LVIEAGGAHKADKSLSARTVMRRSRLRQRAQLDHPINIIGTVFT
jgi:hypothetical protein